MPTTIQYGSHQIQRSRTGTTATYTIDCAWADRAAARPKIGSRHPTEYTLYCTEVQEIGLGKPTGSHTYEQCRMTATYSTFQQLDDAPTESWEFGGEVLDTGLGRMWQGLMAQNDYGKCDQSFGVYYPIGIYTLTMVRASIPIAAIITRLGKVNWTTFLNIPAETCLFEGASTESWYDYERGRYFYRLSYRFLVRPMSHNMVWRAPRQARDGNSLLYDADSSPVFVDGPAGQPGWDRPFPPLYEIEDFGPLIGLKPNPPPIRFITGGGRPL